MELKDIKKLILIARKSGVKSMKFDGLEFELLDNRPVRTRAKKASLDDKLAEIPREATLEDINNYIYSEDE